ncbi:MAG: serine protease, partial [Planctomycetota bacterium]
MKRSVGGWIIREALKLSLAIGLFSWIYVEIRDARQEALALTHELRVAQAIQEDRLSGLEESERRSAQHLAQATVELGTVRDDLDRGDRRLERANANLRRTIDDRTWELQTQIEKGIRQVKGSAIQQADEVRDRVALLERSVRRHPQSMKRRMIYPVVQLRGNGTVGSGVVIWSKRQGGDEDAEGTATTLILTASHVVHEILGEGEEASSDRVDDLRFLDPDTDQLFDRSWEATVVVEDQEADVALLRVDLLEPWPYVASLADHDEIQSVQIFDPVYAVGCPLGNKPLPTVGEISSQEKMVSGQRFWMINAPTFFGNSGGGIFMVSTGRLVGISSMIYTYGKRQPMVVPHMGL